MINTLYNFLTDITVVIDKIHANAGTAGPPALTVPEENLLQAVFQRESMSISMSMSIQIECMTDKKDTPRLI